jgi:hypothetical protein
MNASSAGDPTYVLGRSDGETSRLQAQAELLESSSLPGACSRMQASRPE